MSVNHWRRSGEVPVGFRPSAASRHDAAVGDFLCSAPAGLHWEWLLMVGPGLRCLKSLCRAAPLAKRASPV
jgi:hypothetical protein